MALKGNGSAMVEVGRGERKKLEMELGKRKTKGWICITMGD